MICENGRVVSIEGDWVWVETLRTSSCVSCSAKAGCGQNLLNSIFSGKRHYVKVALNGFAEQVKLHDEVEIAIPENGILKGSLLMYIFPLLMLIVGAGAAQELVGENNGYSILGAIMGFVSALLIVRVHSYLHRSDPSYLPILHKILSSPVAAASVQTLVIK